MKKYSVIIPTLNEELFIYTTLTCLSQQTLKPAQVIIVDGNSTDQTLKIVRQFKNKLPMEIMVTARGVGKQRSIGGEAAQGSVLVFFDADVQLRPDFMEKSLSEYTKRHLSSACPWYMPDTKSLFTWLIYGVFNSIFWGGQHTFPAGAGSCMFVDKKIFNKIGGFNHQLLTDDLDFIYRAGKAGVFGQLHSHITVSDRRFRTYGILPTLWQYLHISYYFMRQQLHKCNTLHYTFGDYAAKKSLTRSRTK